MSPVSNIVCVEYVVSRICFESNMFCAELLCFLNKVEMGPKSPIVFSYTGLLGTAQFIRLAKLAFICVSYPVNTECCKKCFHCNKYLL